LNREVVPGERELRDAYVDTDGDSPRLREELLKVRLRSAELGFYSVDMPVELGGGGLSFTGAALLREVAASTGSFLALACLAGPEGPTPLLAELQPHVRDRIMPGWLRGEASGCFALTEPDAGSDDPARKTRA